MSSEPRPVDAGGSGIYLVETRGSVYSDRMSPSQAESSRVAGTDWPSGCVGIGEFWFHPETGELHGKSGDGEIKRLPPQPARLLTFLIDKRGAIASRDEIRELLWPDVEVDFDQGLHFCVRQVRAALGDSAGEPRYIQTLARRGYRLMVPVEIPTEPLDASIPAAEPVPDLERTSTAPSYGSLGLSLAATVAVVIAAAVWMAAGFAPQPTSVPADTVELGDTVESGDISQTAVPPVVPAKPPTLAIMSFRAPAESPDLETHRIADLLLARFSAYAPARLGLVGPTTTAAYDTDLHAVSQLVRDRPVEFVINGRFLTGRQAGQDHDDPRLIVELIRADDGAHEWVEVFDPRTDPEQLAAAIGDGLVGYFGLGEPPELSR